MYQVYVHVRVRKDVTNKIQKKIDDNPEQNEVRGEDVNNK